MIVIISRRVLLTFIFTYFCIQFAFTQVNTEKMRLWADSSGFSGNVNFATKLIKGNSELFQLDVKLNLLYKHKKHLMFSLNNFSQTHSGDNKIIDKGFSLLRYNYEFTDKYIWEVFLQGEFNHLRKLDRRFLVGSAFRYIPFHTDNVFGAIGIAIMREEEAISDTTFVKYRASDYFTLEIQINDILSFTNTIYYQPRLSDWSDFRLLNEGAIRIKVFKRIELWSAVQYRYDSEPPALVKHYDIELKNGIRFYF